MHGISDRIVFELYEELRQSPRGVVLAKKRGQNSSRIGGTGAFSQSHAHSSSCRHLNF